MGSCSERIFLFMLQTSIFDFEEENKIEENKKNGATTN